MAYKYYTLNNAECIGILSQHEVTVDQYLPELPYISKYSETSVAYTCRGTGMDYAFNVEELSQFLFMLSLVQETEKEEYALSLIESIWKSRPENKEDW